MKRNGVVSSLRVMVGLAFQAHRAGALAQILLSLLNSFGFVVQAYGLKLLVDAAVAGNAGKAVWGAVALAGLSAVGRTANNLGFRYLATLQERADLLLDERIMGLAAGVPTLEHYEHAEYANEINLLRQDRAALSQVLQALVAFLGVVFRAVFTLGLLASLHPALLLLPLFAIPSLFTAARGTQLEVATQEALAEPFRRLQHLFTIGTTAAPGKELRVFGLESELVTRYRNDWQAVVARTSRTELRVALLETLGWLTFGIGFSSAIAIVALRALSGSGTPGDVALAFTLAGQVNNLAGGAAGTVAYVVRMARVAGRLVWLQDYARDHATRIERPAEVPPRLQSGLAIEAVSFTYPGTDRPVLENISVSLPAGAVVAVVGENGAGKTTLVKLLCKLYEPTTGRITVDGVDLARIAHDEWRRRAAGAFQDFARFEFVARETVGVGNLEDIDDEAAIAEALDRASATDVVAGLDIGLATQLGRSYTEGAELSGGQWQKLALGRSMMRGDPVLLVLDEPTAALDAEAEHALFERYASAARRAASTTGGITVLVSHRFSTVRMADLILVLDSGCLIASGSHAELMQRGGLYAELYELQARAYR
ncbi:MAG TPA: ABC transporter ATP-binding protein [Acidimicrobiales bacterium]|nr:ABC transporter ATP-binding protein [Acidimicrobiales bacterium]